MSWLPVPWAIGGGIVEIPVEAGRAVAHAASGGQQGVTSGGDCRITALTVPGPAVKMSAGSVVVINRSLGAKGQAYVATSPTGEASIPISPTSGSGGRSDLVVVRIRDPQYPPWEVPGDPNNYDYVQVHVIEDVPSDTATFEELGLDYSALALARIDIPPSTSTITAGMVTNLRRVIRPFQKFVLSPNGIPDDSTVVDSDAQTVIYETGLTVPSWATLASIVVTLSGIKATGPISNFEITFRIVEDNDGFGITGFTALTTVGVGYREMAMLGSDGNIAEYAGSQCTLQIRGRYLQDGSNSTGQLAFDNYTRVVVQVNYEEYAV